MNKNRAIAISRIVFIIFLMSTVFYLYENTGKYKETKTYYNCVIPKYDDSTNSYYTIIIRSNNEKGIYKFSLYDNTTQETTPVSLKMDRRNGMSFLYQPDNTYSEEVKFNFQNNTCSFTLSDSGLLPHGAISVQGKIVIGKLKED